MYQQTLLQIGRWCWQWKLSSKPAVASTRRCTTLCCKWPSQNFPTVRLNDAISCHFNKLNCKSDSKNTPFQGQTKQKKTSFWGKATQKLGETSLSPRYFAPPFRPEMPVYQGPPFGGPPKSHLASCTAKRSLKTEDGHMSLTLGDEGQTIWKATKLRFFQETN